MPGSLVELNPESVRAVASAHVAASGRRRPARADLVGASLAAIGSLLAAAFSLQLWRAHLHVPLVYDGDQMINLMAVKSILSGGWVWTYHSLGAPFGLQVYDFPFATDDLNFLVMRLIGLFTGDPAKVINIFFILTFPAAAVSGYAVLRWLGISVATGVACAVLFADLPFHLLRGEGHLLLSSYVSVPIATYLAVSLLDGRRLWLAELRPLRLGSLFCWRNAFFAVLCLLVGSLGVYYAVFTMLIVGAAGFAGAAGRQRWWPLVHGAVIVVAIAGVSFLNDLPAAIYTSQHGKDTAVAHRLPRESETFALTLAQMVLPVPSDRITALRAPTEQYDNTTPVLSEFEQQPLGLVASAGLAWMLAIAVVAVAGFNVAAPWLRRQRQLAFAAMVAFLIATFGGISALIAYLITPEIRAWNRISIFIAFFALAAVGLGLDAFARRFLRERRVLAVAGLGAVLLFGIYEQSSTLAIPAYAATGRSYGSDTLFVDAIQRIMQPGAAIYQLPYMVFPEAPAVNNMLDYDPLRGYVHSTDLRWSYPSMAGRPQDWASQTGTLPVQTLLDGVVAAGFSGLWIDRFGYADRGLAIVTDVSRLVGAAPMTSRDGRFEFFDLRPYAARLRARSSATALAGLRHAMIYPLEIGWVSGFYPPEPGGLLWAMANAVATVDNTSSRPRRAEFFADAQTYARGHFTLTIEAPDGSRRRFAITQRPRPVQFTFTVPPGASEVQFHTTAPEEMPPGDPRSLAVHFQTPLIYGAAITPFVPGRPSA